MKRIVAVIAAAGMIAACTSPTLARQPTPTITEVYTTVAQTPEAEAAEEVSPNPTTTASSQATLVQTIDTSQWSPPSPDSAGIVYLPASNRLLVSDSEVDEMPIFSDDNLFEATLTGNLIDTWTTISFSDEPTGITHNPSNGHLFFSDDQGQQGVYELNPGPDGLYDTPDDIVTSFVTKDFGSSDPEGVAFASGLGVLFVADGASKAIYQVAPGSNGIFDGVPPAGDDKVTSFDTAGFGQTNPEGIAFNPDTGNLYIVGRPRNTLFEVTTAGTLVQRIDISAADITNPAGLAYAPSSQNPGKMNIYIAARGVDNSTDPNENDGKVYELTLPPTNDPAVAVDDSASTAEDTAVTIDLSTNDSDPQGSLDLASANTTCATCTTTSNGSLANIGNGVFAYTPDPDFNGSDSFVYEICDTLGACDTATVTITVNPANNPLQFTESYEDFANPERGFMRQVKVWPDGTGPFGGIRRQRSEDSLVWIYFRLDNYREQALDTAGLDRISLAFDAVRNAELKVVATFTYNFAVGEPDAPLSRVLEHISQLTPIFQQHADVLLALQAGFVGAWGEWHSSTNDLTSPENQKAILDALINALPPERMLQLRYPRDKNTHYGGPLADTDAFSGTDAARVGHHNLCFLAGDNDEGTYRSTPRESPSPETIQYWKDFIAQEGRFTPVGGETCRLDPPRSECPTALQELEMLHWSYLHNGYRKEVLESWTTGGCRDTIRRRLGYRLVLKEASIPQTVKAGGALNFEVLLNNVGYAAMYNARSVYGVLQNENNRYEFVLTGVDPRRWEAGLEYTINASVTLPINIISGTYKLGLWLPDEAISLRDLPAYAARFANTDVWEPATALNILTTNLLVTSTSINQRPAVDAVRDQALSLADSAALDRAVLLSQNYHPSQ